MRQRPATVASATERLRAVAGGLGPRLTDVPSCFSPITCAASPSRTTVTAWASATTIVSPDRANESHNTGGRGDCNPFSFFLSRHHKPNEEHHRDGEWAVRATPLYHRSDDSFRWWTSVPAGFLSPRATAT